MSNIKSDVPMKLFQFGGHFIDTRLRFVTRQVAGILVFNFAVRYDTKLVD